MTLREFVAALAAFFVLYVLFVVAVIAAPQWKAQVRIEAWCYDLATIEAVAEADAVGNPEVADGLAAQAFRERRCVRLPLAVAAFRPSGIVKEFPSFGGRPVTVIEGNLLTHNGAVGRTVFVVVPNDKLINFQIAEPVDTPPPRHDQSLPGKAI